MQKKSKKKSKGTTGKKADKTTKQKVMLTRDETATLINEVHVRPALWDFIDVSYSERSQANKNELWEEVAAAEGLNGKKNYSIIQLKLPVIIKLDCSSGKLDASEAAYKFKLMKDSFDRIKRRNNKQKVSGAALAEEKPKWDWYDSMLFLEKVVMDNP